MIRYNHISLKGSYRCSQRWLYYMCVRVFGKPSFCFAWWVCKWHAFCFSLSGCHSYLCGPEATGLIRHTFHPCRSLPEPRATSWQLGYGSHTKLHTQVCTKKKTQILTLFHWTNYRGSFCGDCHTVPLLCSSTSLPSCGILYIWVSERWGSLSFALQPLASLALSTDAIIIFTFRMLVWLCLKVTKSVYQHLSSSVINTFVCVICEKDKV